MAPATSYRAEMIGLGERECTLLRSLLAATQARTGIRWEASASASTVHFVDIDSAEGAAFWQSLTESETRSNAIVVGQSAAPSDTVAWLRKPLRSAALLDALAKLAQLCAAPIRASATPAPATVPAETATPAAVAIDTGLLDILDRAGATTAQTVHSEHWPDLVLSASNTYAMRTAPLQQYVEGFRHSLAHAGVAKYSGGPLSDEQRIELDSLRWMALLYAPMAEISHRLPRPARAQLSAFPDFGALPHSLLHVRMAAWLAKHPASAQELAEMVALDDESVQRFFGACAAIGLLQVVDSPDGAIAIGKDLSALSAVASDIPAGLPMSLLKRVQAARA